MANPVASPNSVVSAVATFLAQPLSSFTPDNVAALGNQLYNLGLSDGLAVPAPASVSAEAVLSDLQGLQSADDAAVAALIQKYSPAPVVAPAS